jgi:hypothetical protein
VRIPTPGHKCLDTSPWRGLGLKFLTGTGSAPSSWHMLAAASPGTASLMQGPELVGCRLVGRDLTFESLTLSFLVMTLLSPVMTTPTTCLLPWRNPARCIHMRAWAVSCCSRHLKEAHYPISYRRIRLLITYHNTNPMTVEVGAASNWRAAAR